MADFLFSINAVVPLFLIMLLGFILKQCHFIGDSFVDSATKVCFNVALPSLLFLSIAQSDLKQAFDPQLAILCLGLILLYVVLLRLLTPRFIPEVRSYSAFIQVSFRSNYVLLGLPFINNLVGPSGLATAAAVLALMVPLFNVLAVLVLSECQTAARQGGKLLFNRIATNPLIIACLAGILYSLSPLALPQLLARSLSYISDMAMPLALIAIGATLNYDKSERDKMRLALVSSSLKLVALPLIAVLIGCYLDFGPVQLAVLLALFAAPPAIACFTMSFQMGSDYQLTSFIIVIGTTLSAFTMFAFVYALRLLGQI